MPLANWVRGVGPDAQVGILVQQLLGQLFSSKFGICNKKLTLLSIPPVPGDYRLNEPALLAPNKRLAMRYNGGLKCRSFAI